MSGVRIAIEEISFDFSFLAADMIFMYSAEGVPNVTNIRYIVATS